MPADAPTILATSGGVRAGRRTELEFDALIFHAVELSRCTRRRPRVAYVGTASGDQRHQNAAIGEAAAVAGFDVSFVNLFSMPNHDDVEAHLGSRDVVWVHGGSVVNLLAVWRAHGLPEILRRVWQSGVVLAGVSAGSICWFDGGATDSFGPDLRPVTDALGFLPYGNGVHYDVDPGRRPLIHDLVGRGVFDEAHCTDDGVGVHYSGTRWVEAVAETPGKGAYVVTRAPGGGVEERRIEPRLL